MILVDGTGSADILFVCGCTGWGAVRCTCDQGRVSVLNFVVAAQGSGSAVCDRGSITGRGGPCSVPWVHGVMLVWPSLNHDALSIGSISEPEQVRIV